MSDDDNDHLAAFVQKWIPDAEESGNRETVDKQHEEPVERKQRQITLMCREVTVQRRQLLRHNVLQHPLQRSAEKNN